MDFVDRKARGTAGGGTPSSVAAACNMAVHVLVFRQHTSLPGGPLVFKLTDADHNQAVRWRRASGGAPAAAAPRTLVGSLPRLPQGAARELVLLPVHDNSW